MDGDRLQEFCSRVENTKNKSKNIVEILSEIEGAKVDGIIIYTDPLKVLKVV